MPACVLALVLVLSSAALHAQQPDANAQIATAFHAAYSLDEDLALTTARSAVAAAPDSASAHRTLAAILWIEIIFRRGAVTIDHYLGGLTKPELSLSKTPTGLEAEFKQELARAIDLANRKLSSSPRDLDARYDLGATYGLQASYLASVEGSMTSAFLAARHAYDAQEMVLAGDPARTGAGLVVGTYRYVVSGLGLPSRMFAYMLGFGGGKETGIGLIEAAINDPRTHVEAKTALVLIFSREGRHADALRLLGELSAEFPRNRLFVLEAGSAAIRAGRAVEADALLTRGLDAFVHDERPKIPGEHALWLYKRGLARLNLNRRPEATADLNAALLQDPEDWVRGRVHLALGKIADLSGRRADAIVEYKLAKGISGAASDPGANAEADRLLHQPFVMR